MTEYKVYNSPRKAWRLILPGIVFIIIGIIMLEYSQQPKWASWISIAVLGLGVPMGLIRLLDRKPRIIINEIGVFDRSAHESFINWEIIHDAYIVVFFEKEFICLIIDERFKGLKKKRISKIEGFQEYNIALGNVKMNADKFLDFILNMIQAEKKNRDKLIQQLPQHL